MGRRSLRQLVKMMGIYRGLFAYIVWISLFAAPIKRSKTREGAHFHMYIHMLKPTASPHIPL